MEFSKKLMVFVCFVIAAAFAAMIFSYVRTGEGLGDILEFAKWLAVPVVAYMAKSCIENKSKIETDYLEKKNSKKLT